MQKNAVQKIAVQQRAVHCIAEIWIVACARDVSKKVFATH